MGSDVLRRRASSRHARVLAGTENVVKGREIFLEVERAREKILQAKNQTEVAATLRCLFRRVMRAMITLRGRDPEVHVGLWIA